MDISANTLVHDEITDTFRASGNVVIKWGDASLTSDKAAYDQGKNEATAEGRVTLKRSGEILTSDRLILNTETEKGEVTNGDLFLKQSNFHIRGEKMAKVGEEDYSLERGSFTTCDGDSPSWRFSAKKLDVTLGEYATGEHAVFYVKDVPLFYFPYLVFPVKRERQSGFLFPKIGSSTKKGFNVDIPYYWAISPSQDLTVDLDVQTKRGVGLGGDYRYLRPRGSDGHLQGYWVYDTSQSRSRGVIDAKQREYLSDTVTVRSDINAVTDRDFFRDFAVAPGIYNQQILDSSVSLTKKWDDGLAAAELRVVQELRYRENVPPPDNGLTLKRLPTLTYNLLGRRLGSTPLSVSLDSSFVNFYRQEGQTGQRLEVHPALTTAVPLPGGGASLWAGYLQKLYQASNEAEGDGTRSTGLVDAGAVATSSVEQVYAVRLWGAEKIKHTLVPEIGLRFVQQKNQESLPFFDFNDRIPGETTVGWAVSNYITGKFTDAGNAADYRELLHLRLSQEYTMSGQRRNLLVLTDPLHRLSDLRVQARLSPATWLTVTSDNRFDTTEGRFSTALLSADFKDGRGNLAGLGYHMSRDVVEYLEGKLGLSLVKPFVFNYTGRYSFDKGGFLETLYSLEYKQQCWSVTLSFRDRPDNREFLVNFNLAGVGALGPLKAL